MAPSAILVVFDSNMCMCSFRAVRGCVETFRSAVPRQKHLHAGQMGSGIAQVAACAGLNVTLCDTSAIAIQTSAESLKVSLGYLVGQGAMSPAAAEAAALRIVRSTDIQASACRALCLQDRQHESCSCFRCHTCDPHRGP